MAEGRFLKVKIKGGIWRPGSYFVGIWGMEKVMETTLQGFDACMAEAERKIRFGVYGFFANGAVGDRQYDA